MLAAAMVTIEMNVAAAEAMILVMGSDDIVSNYQRFANYRRRSPISRGPAAVGRVIAVNPRVARSGARRARYFDRRGSAESDSNVDVRGCEKAASQKHHYRDRLFHFLALLA